MEGWNAKNRDNKVVMINIFHIRKNTVFNRNFPRAPISLLCIYTSWAGLGFPCSCLVLRGSGSRQLQQPTTTSVRLLGTPCSCTAMQVQQPSISSEGLGLGSGSRVRFSRWTGGRFCSCTTISAGLGSPSSWTARLRRSLSRYMARSRAANSICCLHRLRSAARTRELWRVVFRRRRAKVRAARAVARLSRRVLQP